MPITRRELVLATTKFFSLHWPGPEKPPTWSGLWTGVGAAPQQELPGCFVLLKGGDIEFLGAGYAGYCVNRRASGIERGLYPHVRLERALFREDGQLVFSFRRGYTGAYTIGFQNFSYLACALEHFLIDRFAVKFAGNKFIAPVSEFSSLEQMERR